MTASTPREIDLMTPIEVGGMLLPNRMVMSSMTRGRAVDGVPGELMVEYYRQRADAGLVFAESTAICPRGRGFRHNPCLFDDTHVAAWRRVTDAVHARGGRMFLQLWHVGHNSHPLMQPDGGLPVGPSAIPVKGVARTPEGVKPLVTPRALMIEEMPGIAAEYRAAAERARRANFDGVEVHAGNGYLLDQFLRDSTNKRTDAYGGPPENRRRLLLEVVDAVAQVYPRDRISVRISPTNPAQFDIRDSDPENTFACAVEGLQEAGIGILDVVEGDTKSDVHQPFDYSILRRRFGGVYIANNRYTFGSANAALRGGHADLVSFGRLYVANPDLVRRYQTGAPLNAINQETLYSGLQDAVGYTDYPFLD
jgi:N-ethylmaleimide reductase